MANSYTNAEGVFHNKLGITDAAQLKRVEYDLSRARANEILEKRVGLGVQGFGLARQQAIHQHVFQDIYEWAGKTRAVASSKRAENGMASQFETPDSLQKSWQALEQRTNAFASAKGLTFEQKRDALVGIYIEANRIHPFPEGNGRSLQVFMKELAREQGVELDYSKVDSKEWNLASAVSGTNGRLFEHRYLIPNPPDPEPIKKLFTDMASPSRELAPSKALLGGQTAVTQPYQSKAHDVNQPAPGYSSTPQAGAAQRQASAYTLGKTAAAAKSPTTPIPQPQAKSDGPPRSRGR